MEMHVKRRMPIYLHVPVSILALCTAAVSTGSYASLFAFGREGTVSYTSGFRFFFGFIGCRNS